MCSLDFLVSLLTFSRQVGGCIQKLRLSHTEINTPREATKRVMAAKLTGLTYEIGIQLHVVAESCTICSSRWKLLDTTLYFTKSVNLLQAK